MCGIAGACWTGEGEPIDEAVLKAMTDAIVHRGPDASGSYLKSNSQGGVALGHRRLSIIDLAAGKQPLCNEDETVWVTFNGEIYNFEQLRPELEAKGHKFRTHSDTEVIVHCYEEYGDRFLEHLRGMFAFALWDANRNRLLIARDRLGQKPLVYKHEGNRILFASELKSLLKVPGIAKELEPTSIDLFLTYQYVPHPYSIIKGFAKLPPGCFGVFENGNWTVKPYWEPPYDSVDQAHSEQSKERLHGSENWSADRWKKELHDTVTEAVKLRMRSDVPLGAFLSGGIDSTIIAGVMQRLSASKIHTFSIGFPIAQFDESSAARETAGILGSEHHEFIVEPEALSILPDLYWHYDEPFSDSSAIPTTYLSRVTREHVTVALSGDGGDELFAGYDRYKAVSLAGKLDRLPSWMRKVFAAELWQKIPSRTEQKSFRRRLKRFLQAMGQSPERRYLRWIGIFQDHHRQDLYTQEFKEELGRFDSALPLLEAYEHCRSRDFITQTTCTDVLTYLPCDILTKVDIASMSTSLECRSPFLDHHVVELAARMPIELKRNANVSKKILKETFADLIPDAILSRPKMGFGVPINHWFRNELKDLLYETVLSDRAMQRGYFRRKAVQSLVEDHVRGVFDHSYRLWSLLMLEGWHRTFLD